MLSETNLTLLQQLVRNASNEEIIWANGYLAGFLDKNQLIVNVPNQPIIPAVTIKPLLIYGTETGNSKRIASQLLVNFKKQKIQAKAVDVFQYDFANLEKERLVLFIMSTQGEGEFPQNATGFYEKLKASKVQLNQLCYAVFGLGDSSYPLFCNAGKLLDDALTEKGAIQLLPLVKADVDFADAVIQWEKDLQNVLVNQVPVEKVSETKGSSSSKKNFSGLITHKVILNDRESNKETYHIEITPDEEVPYEPGDALGIFPKNKSADVAIILNYFKVKSNENISINGETTTAEEWLLKLNIKGLSKRTLESISKLFEITITEEKADLIDILNIISNVKQVTLTSLLELLVPIAPRLYSISSSAEAHDGQVHLTVNLNQFKSGDVVKTGLASHYLADFPLNTKLDFYIHKNKNFRLPAEDQDIIMIGPGTGIAPFRSFLAHRDSTGAEGKNWLFFGEQHFVSDFYYQTEIQEWISTRVLSRLDTAFSRDQKQKIYVQDRIKEKAQLFNEWLENGASIYICGQKNPMSLDVEQAIVEVISQQRKVSQEEAKKIVEQLELDGRFHKDVY